ncbi:LECT2 protein, partial [Herpetotheres cachinnans]|nr:LECT2 protein [Herpetotheres cachinnans]
WVSSSVLLFFSFLATAAQWAKICSSQPANKIRGCDSQGCGGYNETRGKKQRGADEVCKDGSVVYAPFTGKIDNHTRPYGNSNAINNSGQLSGSATRAERPAYFASSTAAPSRRGRKIGVLIPMQRIYRGITSHVHIQNCDLTDLLPTCKQ